MNWKEVLFHFFRLALAAVLLAWDLRVFLFYAFTLLLTVLHHLNRLRAIVRVFQVINETNTLTLMQHTGVPPGLYDQVFAQYKSNTPQEDWDSLEEDFRRARRRA